MHRVYERADETKPFPGSGLVSPSSDIPEIKMLEIKIPEIRNTREQHSGQQAQRERNTKEISNTEEIIILEIESHE